MRIRAYPKETISKSRTTPFLHTDSPYTSVSGLSWRASHRESCRKSYFCSELDVLSRVEFVSFVRGSGVVGSGLRSGVATMVVDKLFLGGVEGGVVVVGCCFPP